MYSTGGDIFLKNNLYIQTVRLYSATLFYANATVLTLFDVA